MHSEILNQIADYLKKLIETNINGVTVYDTEQAFVANAKLPAIIIKWNSHTNSHNDLNRNRRVFNFNISALTPIGCGSNAAADAERDERSLVGELINLLENNMTLDGLVSWAGLITHGQSLVSQEEINYRVYSCSLDCTVISQIVRTG